MNIKLERKRFHYFMRDDNFPFAAGQDYSNIIPGWMRESCAADDMALIKWCATAEVGTMFQHRTGTVVRLKNYAQGDGE